MSYHKLAPQQEPCKECAGTGGSKWPPYWCSECDGKGTTSKAPQQEVPAAEWLEQAYREGWAACRDAETIGEEAEDWAFGNSTANSRMIDMQQAAPQQEVQAVDDLAKELDAVREALQWYMRRCDHLQRAQHRMRDPERTMVCDILANGSLLVPEGQRYTAQPAPTQEVQEPTAFIHWPVNGPPTLVWYSNKALEDAILKTYEGHQPDVKLYTAQPTPSGDVELIRRMLDVWLPLHAGNYKLTKTDAAAVNAVINAARARLEE